ncbi:uncharacterized protein LOC110721955 [Chenopodium quinoa]|uniref:uncharacterized protein LOC110721955 n=1 Tax=Chenopodium quinoa TaxID=63459 RepID=UPI000B79A125|nr:uncharacterized protein LOC110721955 [Chenopodium quinoa]
MADTPPPPPPKIESNSPYYLGPRDRSGDFITSQRLKLDNYNEWSHAIYIALSSRRKFGFLDGTITSYAPPCTKDDWVTIHCMLVSLLMNTIDPEVRSTLSNYDNAKKLWDDLQELFGLVNGPRIQQIKSEISRCKQPKSMHVAVYFSKLSVLWDELDKHEPLINCKCGKCTCDIEKQHIARRDGDRLQQFLLGLYSDFYAALRSTLLSQDPLPSLNRAFQTIAQEERVRGIANHKEEPPEVVGFAARMENKPKPRLSRAEKAALVCTYCQQKGHDASTCFARHGVPEWYTERYGLKEPNKRPVGRSNNTSDRGQNTQIKANATPPTTAPVYPPAAAQIPPLSAEQWQAVMAVMGNTQPPPHRVNGKWIIDTGCSHHVTGNLSCLTDVREVSPCNVGLLDGQNVIAMKEGVVKLTEKITLSNVLFVPKLNCNLISVSQLCFTSSCEVITNSLTCTIQDQRTREVIGTGDLRDGLYYFREEASIAAVSIEDSSNLKLWHRRLGHPSEKVVKLLPFLSNSRGHLNKDCEVCHRSKHTRDKFPLSENKASRIFEIVHCDLWGPYKEPSSCGAHYFLTLVDDYSRAVWIYLLNDKTEVFKMFMSFIAMIDRQFSQKIKIVRSDNGTEFFCLKNYFLAQGIIFQTSCVGTPQQNGRVERKHQHILNVARALRFQGGLPIYFWGECALAAAHLINRTPTVLINNKTPYEILFGTPPLFSELRVFGSSCFAHNQRAKSDKFASRSQKCVFVGYPFGKKGWYLYDLDKKEFFVSRDVRFFEDVHPYLDADGTNIDVSTPNMDASVDLGGDLDATYILDEDQATLDEKRQQQPPVVTVPPQPAVAAVPTPEATVQEDPTAAATTPDDMGRGHRQKFVSTRLKGFVTHAQVTRNSPSSSPAPVAPPPPGMSYPIAHYVSCDKFSAKHRNFVAAITSGKEPRFLQRGNV